MCPSRSQEKDMTRAIPIGLLLAFPAAGAAAQNHELGLNIATPLTFQVPLQTPTPCFPGGCGGVLGGQPLLGPNATRFLVLPGGAATGPAPQAETLQAFGGPGDDRFSLDRRAHRVWLRLDVLTATVSAAAWPAAGTDPWPAASSAAGSAGPPRPPRGLPGAAPPGSGAPPDCACTPRSCA